MLDDIMERSRDMYFTDLGIGQPDGEELLEATKEAADEYAEELGLYDIDQVLSILRELPHDMYRPFVPMPDWIHKDSRDLTDEQEEWAMEEAHNIWEEVYGAVVEGAIERFGGERAIVFAISSKSLRAESMLTVAEARRLPGNPNSSRYITQRGRS